MNEDSRTLEFSQRVFLDDLELAINQAYNAEVDLTNPKNKQRLDSLIKDYICLKVSTRIDQKMMKLNYLGYEVEDGVYWFYLESSKLPGAFTQVEITNTVLFDIYEDQSNIIHWMNNNKSLRLTPDKTTDSFQFTH